MDSREQGGSRSCSGRKRFILFSTSTAQGRLWRLEHFVNYFCHTEEKRPDKAGLERKLSTSSAMAARTSRKGGRQVRSPTRRQQSGDPTVARTHVTIKRTSLRGQLSPEVSTSSFRAAVRFATSPRRSYRMVVFGSAWPASCWTTKMSAPAASRSVMQLGSIAPAISSPCSISWPCTKPRRRRFCAWRRPGGEKV